MTSPDFDKFRTIYGERVVSVQTVTALHPLFWRKSHKNMRNYSLRNVQKSHVTQIWPETPIALSSNLLHRPV